MKPKPSPDLGFAKRFLQALDAKGISQNELARRLDVDKGTVSRWGDGSTTPSFSILERIAKELDVGVDFLVTGKDRTRIVYEVDKNARPVPLAGVGAAGAPMAMILEENIPQFHMPEGFLREIYGTKPDAERAILLRVVGDSMEDDLPDGSLVFIDRGPGGKGFDRSGIRDGDIYMVIPPGEDGVTLKRVSIHGDFMTLEAANRDRKRYPLLHYPIKGLTVPHVVRGRVVAKLQKTVNS